MWWPQMITCKFSIEFINLLLVLAGVEHTDSHVIPLQHVADLNMGQGNCCAHHSCSVGTLVQASDLLGCCCHLVTAITVQNLLPHMAHHPHLHNIWPKQLTVGALVPHRGTCCRSYMFVTQCKALEQLTSLLLLGSVGLSQFNLPLQLLISLMTMTQPE